MSAEDKIIAKITLHRDIKELMMQKLRQAGVACRETEFTDSNGDILIENSDDVDKVQRIIHDLQHKANP